jgi:hypothetical protein
MLAYECARVLMCAHECSGLFSTVQCPCVLILLMSAHQCLECASVFMCADECSGLFSDVQCSAVLINARE